MANSLTRENAILRNMISSPKLSIVYKSHARTEMKNDGIISGDIERVIKLGRVTWVEWKTEELWHIEGRDLDHRKIRIIVVVYADECIIKLITAFTIK